MVKNSKKLSIIITSFQRPELLKWGLVSLLKQKINFTYEIIVVNDGLEDDTIKVCKSFTSLPIKYIHSGTRNKETLKWRVAGFAINIGIKQAMGEKIIITCAEIFHLDTDTVQNTVDNLNDIKNIVITEGLDDTRAVFLNHLRETQGNFANNVYEKRIGILDTLNTKLPFFMGLDRKEIVKIGGYDEDFIGYAYDDADFTDRLLDNGMDFIQLKNRVVHLYHQRNTNRPGVDNMMDQLYYNKDLYEKRKGIVIRNVNRKWGQL